MDASIKLEEEEGGKEEKQGEAKTKENFDKKLSKVEVRVPTKEEKLSTLGPRGKKRLAPATISAIKENKYFPMKSGLARAQQDLKLEGYGLFPQEFVSSGLWQASDQPSDQQIGLLKHVTEDGKDLNIFNLRSAKTFRFGEEKGMSWTALKLVGKEPLKAPEAIFNPFCEQYGDDYPLPR